MDYNFGNIEFDVTKFVGAREKKMAINKIKNSNFTKPEEALRSVINYYINNHMNKGDL